MDLKQLGEFGLIRRISREFSVPSGVTGIGDDCAVLPQQDGLSTLVTTDMLVEGTHFLSSDISPYRLGWKSAAVNISDIAAMGGAPRGSFLAFALPKGLDSTWTDEFIRGYKEASLLSGTPLLGGDTTASPDRISICVTVIGDCPSGREVRRSGARTGDLVCVTGALGDSAGGLRVILDGIPRSADEEALVDRHYRPVPKVTEGQAIAKAGASAMMDISDGIGSDLQHILDASGVGAEIECKAIPTSAQLRSCAGRHGWDTEALAIDGGEDYELLFTIDPAAVDSPAFPCHVIGRIVDGDSVTWLHSASGRHQGYKHF